MNIYLYYGDDDFTMTEKINKEKKSFEKKGGGFNIYEIDWDNQSISKDEKLSKLKDGLSAGSLFSSEKLIIVKNCLFPSGSKKKNNTDNQEEINKKKGESEKDELILKYFKNLQEEVKIFFIEDGTDKRKKTYKELVKYEQAGLAKIKEFIVPAGLDFKKWLKRRIEKAGGKINQETLEVFSISLGQGLALKEKGGKINQAYNLWEANNEIDKLVSYCEGREIEKADLKLLVKSKVDMNIFNLIDALSSRNKNKALLLLNEQLEMGLNENYILSMFVYQFRNLLKVKSLLEQNLSNQEIVAKTKLHPFVVQKSIQQSQKFEIQTLKKIYKKILDADSAMKTGKMNGAMILDLIIVSV